jgi:hypothetical protein
MAYFNHAFCKAWLAKGAAVDDDTATSDLTAGQFGLVDGRTWLTDAAADIAGAKHLAYLVGGNYHAADNIGNNPGHGGYRESIKSKGINFNYISRLGVAQVVPAAQATATLEVGSTCAPCGQNLFVRADVKGSPALRFLNHNAYAIGDSSGDAAANGADLPGLCCVDGQEYLDPAMALAASIQMILADPITAPFIAEGTGTAGSPATFSAAGTATGGANTYTAVAQDSTSGSGSGATFTVVVDAANAITSVVVDSAAGAAQGYEVGDTIVLDGTFLSGGASPANDITLTVLSLEVYGIEVNTGGTITNYSISQILNGTYSPSIDPVGDDVSAKVTVVGAFVGTSFSDCSFDTRDFYNKEPVSIILSAMDETGNPCNDCGVATATPGQMAQTQGETVLRDLLLTERYAQNPFNQGNRDSSRIREIEGFDPILAAVDRTKLYRVYYLQHSVPRLNNPSGVFDNDQYLYSVYVDEDDTDAVSNLDAIWGEIETECAAVGNYTVDIDTGL